ncbi:MAG: FAD/NAD(P)-binding protein [Proteobacteria bacterium]|nr:FAD/NAD(P)-binding protein [Pseudomonadota bacterium]
MSSPRTIVIVGAGFSGTLVAANLLKSQHWAATHIILVERAAKIARGKAYAECNHPYLLNVPAGRMSADSNSPLDFLNFAQHRIPDATAEDFLPRELYGEYLEAALLDAEVAAAPHVGFQRVKGDICRIEPRKDAGYRCQLSDGSQIDADDVVLALGNPGPTGLPGTEDLGDQYISDPWSGSLTFTPGETVLLVGTGLTMADATMAAAAETNDEVVIHALSRHGLIPPSQTQFSQNTCKADTASMFRAASFSALTLLRSVRELADETERRGGDWRETITFIRNVAPQLWQRLPAREKRRFLRHVRPYWDVHRHRLPSQTLARMNHLRRHQKLNVHAGRLLKFEVVPAAEATRTKVRVTWRPRGGDALRTLLVDRVINCTGPDYSIRRSRDPLIRSLVEQGLASPDALSLGMRTGPYGALINAQGHEASNLFYVGPMLRADHWETTAAQELRGYAERLAGYLSAPIGRMRAVASA